MPSEILAEKAFIRLKKKKSTFNNIEYPVL